MAKHSRVTARLVALALYALVVCAQTPITLEQASSRREPDLTPAYQDQKVIVQGVVTSKPILYGEFAHLPIRDDQGHGMLLEAPDFMFERVTPGDLLEVRGTVSSRNGTPVVQPAQLTTVSQSKPPEPLTRHIQQLQNIHALGLTVLVRGRVVEIGEDRGGQYVLLDDGQKATYPIYLPRLSTHFGTGLNRYHVGDRIQVIGTSAQADSEPPFDGKFRMVITDPSAVQLMEREWLLPPQPLLAVVVFLLSGASIWLHTRQKRLSARRNIRRIHGFCEELLTSTSQDEVLRKLRTTAPRVLEASNVELYRYDKGSQVLRKSIHSQTEAVPLLSQNPNRNQAVSLCFQNRTPLHIGDTRRSSLYRNANREQTPRAVVLLPMFAREELTGVLEISQPDRPRYFTMEELTALHHMANQIAMVLKVIEQQTRKEQALRTERIAATGQIINGVAGELKGPLESILALAHRLLDQGDLEARLILNESLRASAILARYGQLTRNGGQESTTLEINSLVQRTVDSCRKEIAASELQLEYAPASEPLWAEGSSSQMESVIKNLVQLAAMSGKSSQDRFLRVDTSLSMRRVTIGIRYGVILYDEDLSSVSPHEGNLIGFSVCRGIIHSLGGDVRIHRAGENACRMEIELPVAFPAQLDMPAASNLSREMGSRTLTAMILEPDVTTQRRLISYWTSHRHRAVPVHNEAEAQELLRRLRIDVIFCAVRTGTGNWIEFFDQVRTQVPVFILLADSVEADASTFFPEGDGLLLRKPMEAGEMDRLLERIEQRMESGAETHA